MTRNWTADFAKFRSFLQGIDMDKYSNLRTIKTVEQDLPDQLFPLDLYYKYYWETTDFRDFDQVFEEYWTEKIAEIFKFIEVYFYGCSIQFVQEGLRARMYRIWMSILTQFDFQYLWNSLYPGELISNPTLDKTGIDAIVNLDSTKIGIQIKKISYRREASQRRFTQRQQKQADVIVEVPYLVIDVADSLSKLHSPRTHVQTKEKLKKILQIFTANFDVLPNGFVVFKKEYIIKIRHNLTCGGFNLKEQTIVPYDSVLEVLQ